MAHEETPRERIARYRRLIAGISDERALKALSELCEELESPTAGEAGPAGGDGVSG